MKTMTTMSKLEVERGVDDDDDDDDDNDNGNNNNNNNSNLSRVRRPRHRDACHGACVYVCVGGGGGSLDHVGWTVTSGRQVSQSR